MSASVYAQIVGEVRQIIARHSENDPTVCAYMVMRVAALDVRGLRGDARAAELAYAIADELAGTVASKSGSHG